MMGFSIPSTGIILGFEAEASAAMASADVFSPLVILVSSNSSNRCAISCRIVK